MAKARIGRAAQQAIEFFDLPALAFPSHPQAFLLVPLAIAVEQIEATASWNRMPFVERPHLRPGRGENLAVGGTLLGDGVGEVAQQGEMDAGVEVPQRLNLEMRQQRLDTLHAAEQRRDDDHRPTGLGNVALELEARQRARLDQTGQQPLHGRDGQLGRRDEREQDDGRQHWRAAVAEHHRVGDACKNHERGQQPDGPEVDRRRMAEDGASNPFSNAWRELDDGLELGPAWARQVVPHVQAPIGARPCAAATRHVDAFEGDAGLVLGPAIGEQLDGPPILIAAGEVHVAIDARRVATQDLLDVTHALEEAAPVQGAGEPEAGDGVGHRHLIGGLVLAFDADRVLRRHVPLREPLVDLLADRRDMRAVPRGCAAGDGR